MWAWAEGTLNDTAHLQSVMYVMATPGTHPPSRERGSLRRARNAKGMIRASEQMSALERWALAISVWLAITCAVFLLGWLQ